MLNLSPSRADYDELFEGMPLAAERLKVIVLTRMVGELRDELARCREGGVEMTGVEVEE